MRQVEFEKSDADNETEGHLTSKTLYTRGNPQPQKKVCVALRLLPPSFCRQRERCSFSLTWLTLSCLISAGWYPCHGLTLQLLSFSNKKSDFSFTVRYHTLPPVPSLSLSLALLFLSASPPPLSPDLLPAHPTAMATLPFCRPMRRHC